MYVVLPTSVVPLSLDIGILFRDQTIPDLKNINASDMSLCSCYIHPFVSPAHNTAISQAEDLFDFDVCLRRLTEEILPKLRDRFLACINSAVGSWICVFKDTVVTHQLHHRNDIMTIERLIEIKY